MEETRGHPALLSAAVQVIISYVYHKQTLSSAFPSVCLPPYILGSMMHNVSDSQEYPEI